MGDRLCVHRMALRPCMGHTRMLGSSRRQPTSSAASTPYRARPQPSPDTAGMARCAAPLVASGWGGGATAARGRAGPSAARGSLVRHAVPQQAPFDAGHCGPLGLALSGARRHGPRRYPRVCPRQPQRRRRRACEAVEGARCHGAPTPTPRPVSSAVASTAAERTCPPGLSCHAYCGFAPGRCRRRRLLCIPSHGPAGCRRRRCSLRRLGLADLVAGTLACHRRPPATPAAARAPASTRARFERFTRTHCFVAATHTCAAAHTSATALAAVAGWW